MRTTNQKKILFLATLYTHLSAFHIPYMKLLQKKGRTVVAAASPVMGGKEELEKENIQCWDIPFARSPYNPRNFQAYYVLQKLLQDQKYELIHVHTPVASFMGRYLGSKTRQGKILYTAHGFHFYKGAPLRNWLVYHTAERFAAKWTDGLIVLNKEDYQNALKLGFVSNENLFYIPGVGVEINLFCPEKNYDIRSELNLQSKDVIVACVAELNKNKNHLFLIEAWKEKKVQETNAQLMLIGTGELMNTLKNKVDRENIRNIHFLGYRKDVPNILTQSDLLVLVSKREGLPKSVMEAMASGIPVIASNIRGCQDLIEDGKNGYLINLWDKAALVRRLCELIKTPNLRRQMGIAGKEKVKHYSLDQIEMEMERIYSLYLN